MKIFSPIPAMSSSKICQKWLLLVGRYIPRWHRFCGNPSQWASIHECEYTWVKMVTKMEISVGAPCLSILELQIAMACEGTSLELETWKLEFVCTCWQIWDLFIISVLSRPRIIMLPILNDLYRWDIIFLDPVSLHWLEVSPSSTTNRSTWYVDQVLMLCLMELS